jgi:Protein of unknown function (DUF1344)
MRALSSAIIATGLLAAGTPLADETSGVIKEIDYEKKTFTLDTGKRFVVADEGLVQDLTGGQRVLVQYEEQGGLDVARNVIERD